MSNISFGGSIFGSISVMRALLLHAHGLRVRFLHNIYIYGKGCCAPRGNVGTDFSGAIENGIPVSGCA